MLKRQILQKIVLLCAFLVGASFSLELRPFVQWLNPGEVTISKEQKGVKADKDRSTDYILEGGTELLFTGEYNPMRYGVGMGYRTSLKDGSHEAAPSTIPIWGSFTFGRIDLDDFASPYMGFRAGTLVPLTTDGNWWEKPLNWFVGVGVGAIFPYGVGVELYGEYSSMLKSFDSENLEIRVNSPRFGFLVSFGFTLIHDRMYKARE